MTVFIGLQDVFIESSTESYRNLSWRPEKNEHPGTAHLQADGNEWYARKDRLILQERGNQTKSTPCEGKAREFLLRTLTEHEDVRIKLRALWTLHIMRDGLSENMLKAARAQRGTSPIVGNEATS